MYCEYAKIKNPFEKQVAIDIGNNSEDMKVFLKQIMEVFCDAVNLK